eukprot:2495355-Prymnesium_polylepis.1
MRGGDKGELWPSAKLEEDGTRWMGWSGGRRGKRTGSPNPEGAALSVAGRAACGQGRAGEGGRGLHSFAAPKEQRPGGSSSPRAGRAYFPFWNASESHSEPRFLF